MLFVAITSTKLGKDSGQRLTRVLCCLHGQLCDLRLWFDRVGKWLRFAESIRINENYENQYKYNNLIGMCVICLWTIEEVRPYCFYVVPVDSHMILTDSNDSWWFSLILNDSHGSQWFSLILSNSHDSWTILSDSHWFLLIFCNSHLFSNNSWWFSNNSWWFSAIIIILKWFSVLLMILSNSQTIFSNSDGFPGLLNNSSWFSMILGDFWVILTDSWQFLVILKWFSLIHKWFSVILKWFLLILSDSHDSWMIFKQFSVILVDSWMILEWFPCILGDCCWFLAILLMHPDKFRIVW